MDVEPARLLQALLSQNMDSLRLPNNSTHFPKESRLPVIEHVTNLNNFRIIAFNWLSIGANDAASQDELYRSRLRFALAIAIFGVPDEWGHFDEL